MTLRGIAFTVMFIAWTALKCLHFSWMLFISNPPFLKYLARYERSVIWLERSILHLDYELIGDLPRHGPALVAMKHQSAWETMKLHLWFDNPAVVLKQELLAIPLWGRYAASLEMIPIDRKAGMKAIPQMVAAAKKAMADNRTIVIFPQGTRVAPGAQHAYRAGIIKLYQATGLPIIPVALNSGLFWPRALFRKRPGRITVQVLESIPPGLPGKEAYALLQSRLEAGSNALLPGGEVYDTTVSN